MKQVVKLALVFFFCSIFSSDKRRKKLPPKTFLEDGCFPEKKKEKKEKEKALLETGTTAFSEESGKYRSSFDVLVELKRSQLRQESQKAYEEQQKRCFAVFCEDYLSESVDNINLEDLIKRVFEVYSYAKKYDQKEKVPFYTPYFFKVLERIISTNDCFVDTNSEEVKKLRSFFFGIFSEKAFIESFSHDFFALFEKKCRECLCEMDEASEEYQSLSKKLAGIDDEKEKSVYTSGTSLCLEDIKAFMFRNESERLIDLKRRKQEDLICDFSDFIHRRLLLINNKNNLLESILNLYFYVTESPENVFLLENFFAMTVQVFFEYVASPERYSFLSEEVSLSSFAKLIEVKSLFIPLLNDDFFVSVFTPELLCYCKETSITNSGDKENILFKLNSIYDQRKNSSLERLRIAVGRYHKHQGIRTLEKVITGQKEKCKRDVMRVLFTTAANNFKNTQEQLLLFFE
jgi:hypothetical protein